MTRAEPPSSSSSTATLDVHIVTGLFPSTSETFILEEIVGLLRRGHRVRIVASPPHRDGPRHGEIEDMDLGALVQRRPGGGRRGLIRAAAIGAEALRVSLRSPVPVARSLARTPNGLSRRDVLSALVPARRMSSPDLYHCHFGPLGLALAYALTALEDDTPLITTFHGYDVSRFLRDRDSDVYAHLFERGAGFLAVSERWRRRLLDLGAPSERTFVHRVGIDVSQFWGLEDPGGGPLRVLSIGRFVEKKGFHRALEAVALARAQGVSLRYSIVGDGPLAPSLRRRVSDLSLGDAVTFLGSQPRDRVRSLLQEHDVLLAPSVTAADGDQEGIPVVLMEAMASELAVISTYHSGIPELVEHDVSGLLADEHDVSQLAAHLALLAERPELRRCFGSEGRRKVESDHDVQHQVDRLVMRYRQVLHGASSA